MNSLTSHSHNNTPENILENNTLKGTVYHCIRCGTELPKGCKRDRKYCGRECTNLHRSEMAQSTFTCAFCDKVNHAPRHIAAIRKYCNLKCMAADKSHMIPMRESKVGWEMPEVAKQKISVASVERPAENVFTVAIGGYHDSPKIGRCYYRSSYEKKAFQILDKDANVVNYVIDPVVIVYENEDGMDRRYRPDLQVFYDDGSIDLIEVKPLWRMDDPLVIRKCEAAECYAAERGWDFYVWTEEELGL